MTNTVTFLIDFIVKDNALASLICGVILSVLGLVVFIYKKNKK